jgi:hypothetical protein
MPRREVRFRLQLIQKRATNERHVLYQTSFRSPSIGDAQAGAITEAKLPGAAHHFNLLNQTRRYA